MSRRPRAGKTPSPTSPFRSAPRGDSAWTPPIRHDLVWSEEESREGYQEVPWEPLGRRLSSYPREAYP